jgi:hypothetical protein
MLGVNFTVVKGTTELILNSNHLLPQEFMDLLKKISLTEDV